MSGSMDPIRGPQIAARLERLPFTGFHRRILGVVGLAHLFDAYDALILAFILPVLIVDWGLSPAQVGQLISIGYVGQLCGAVALALLAERIGRRGALQVALAILSILALFNAAATGLAFLMVTRFAQGIGLGGEVPIAASYLNEICPARLRGKLLYILQAIFAAGTLVTALVAVPLIPHFGWRVMFLIGACPMALAGALPLLVPESPRWLIDRGRFDEADRVVEDIERRARDTGHALSEPLVMKVGAGDLGNSSLVALFQSGYAPRTLSTWLIAFCLSIAGYGVLTWMPTLYSRVYHLPLKQALVYGMAPGAASVIGALIGSILVERIGRRRCFIVGFLGGSIFLGYLALVPVSAFAMMVISGFAMIFMTLLLSGIYVYAPEIYPTRIRALGTGTATSWMRIASIIGPLVVGTLISSFGIKAVFLFFSAAAMIGLVTVYLCAIETKGRSLEDIAEAYSGPRRQR